MTPGDKFNELYEMLMKQINKKATITHYEEGRYYEIEDVQIPFWGEIAIISFKSTGNDEYPIVRTVLDSDGCADYGYVSGQEPHFKSWLMRPEAERVLIELEKTIFLLN